MDRAVTYDARRPGYHPSIIQMFCPPGHKVLGKKLEPEVINGAFKSEYHQKIILVVLATMIVYFLAQRLELSYVID